MKFSIKDLVTFTEEIFNGKLHFLCSVSPQQPHKFVSVVGFFSKYKRQVFIVERYGIGRYSNSWTVGA